MISGARFPLTRRTQTFIVYGLLPAKPQVR